METLGRYAEWCALYGLSVDLDMIDLSLATRPTFARWRENAVAKHDEVAQSLGDFGWDNGTLGYGLLGVSKG
jgi:hypothetical protein